jgi:hypothetical protein
VRLDGAAAELSSGTVTWKQQPMLDAVSAAFRFSTTQGFRSVNQDAAPSMLEVTEASVVGLPFPPGPVPSTVRGTWTARILWDHRQLAAGSASTLILDSFIWPHDDASQTRFEGPATFEATLLPKDEWQPGKLEWRVTAALVAHRGHHAWTIEGRDVGLTIWTAPDAWFPGRHPGDLELHGDGVKWQDDRLTLDAEEISMKGHLAEGSPAALLFDTAALSIEGARLASERRPSRLAPAASAESESVDGRFSAEVRVKAMGTQAGYAGDMRVHGNDAGVILGLVQRRDLPKWISSKFEGEPFSLDAKIATADGAARLYDLDLERGALDLQGWWHLARDHHDGALLMEYGGLSVGIEADDPGRVVLRPGQEWLQARPPPPTL